MQSDTLLKTEPDADSPGSNINVSTTTHDVGVDATSKTKPPQTTQTNGFAPPKTDKPRPHVCNTCGRSFARLEHLKRHERSHTKEKPFECPECTRCFARRDLLLRHQQKLHMTNAPSTRPRNGRRESVSSAVSNGRIRKNSMVGNGMVPNGNGVFGHRPRANTISHIDLSGLGFLDNPAFSRMNALGLTTQSMNMGGLPGSTAFDYRNMSHSMGINNPLGLPRLDTQSINTMDVSNSLRTAPPQVSFGGFDVDSLFSPGTTINPAQLHFGNGAVSATQPSFPPLEPFTVHPAIDPQAQMDDFGWMRNWQLHMTQDSNENAIDESSPSRISSGESPGEFNESVTNSTPAMPIPNGNYQWSRSNSQAQNHFNAGPFQLDALGTGLPNLDAPQGTISPNTLHDPTPTADAYFQQAMMLQQQQQTSSQQRDVLHEQQQGFFTGPVPNWHSESPSMSSSSMGGSARQSSVTSVSTDLITDATRQALLVTLSQPSVFGNNHRKYSQPAISSPLSPGGARSSTQGPNLPSTADIRRYVDAFIQHAHPHLPVLHIPTLSLDTVDYQTTIRGGSPPSGLSHNGTNNSSGCLILGMAAIGALYDYDHPASRELFDGARKMLTLYLEERRKADMTAAVNNLSSGSDSHPHTPLWLVQAMLLTVVYGHQCGDKTAADIASTHCAALVSLARTANLARQAPATTPHSERPASSIDMDMADSTIGPGDSVSRHQSAETDLQTSWLIWKNAEERKRTLFAIFIISSLSTTAYNHTPTIMNSEILLDLPCDEELYSAETAQEWQARGGLAAAEATSVSFASALGSLLTANQRQRGGYTSSAYNSNNPLGVLQAGDGSSDNELRPSTFGCLVLINALHNYIWETRSRHHGRQWTPQETESMFSHIEPALSAWQAAWKANEKHRLERPNPLGLGPLSADSIPLLDLAFVRLFVNLGRSKEAFWQRDFDRMADELARGSEIVQHAEGSPTANGDTGADSTPSVHSSADPVSQRRASQAMSTEQASSRRERHLRKAAFYAADSLTIACNYNLTYSDAMANELPIQSAMCFFDCSQVLAEWACTVQERVGWHLGVLGRDPVDFTQVPAIMMLQGEDVELMRKIEQICENLEAKRFQQDNLLALGLDPAATIGSTYNNINLSNCGYGSKILRITAMMLEKAVVWPVTHVMAKALETQASHMDRRAEESTNSR